MPAEIFADGDQDYIEKFNTVAQQAFDGDAAAGRLDDHIDGTADKHGASAIVNTPAGGIAATDVQAAINELDGDKQDASANLTALAGQTGAADKVSYWTAAATLALTTLSSFGRTMIAWADAAAARTGLGLGTLATLNDAPAGTLTGATLAAGVTASSLTSVGTLGTLAVTGAVTGASFNKVAITAPATSATLTIANGKTLTVSNSIGFIGTDGTTMTLPGATATLARSSGSNTFTGQQTFGTIVSAVANGGDAFQILNSSVAGTKGWDFYPVTNGTDTDLNLYEFATSGSGDRFIFKAGGALRAGPSAATTVISAAGHLSLRSYTVATLPAATAQQLIYVSDGTSNKRLAVSDGTNWRWPDGVIVS